MQEIIYDDFAKVELRVGRITEASEFPEAHKPAYKLTIDFGSEIGTRRSSAQITSYSKEELIGKLVVCVVNFPKKQIGPFVSECLTCGTGDENGDVKLLTFKEANIPLGSKIY